MPATIPTTQTASPARPAAEPLLASTLLGPSALDDIFDALAKGPGSGLGNVLALNIPSLDAALGSTFQQASLVALSADATKAIASVSQRLLVDALLRYPEHGVAVVDTTGSFDVVGLYQFVLERLEQEQGEAGLEVRRSGVNTVQERAAKTLDRVRILRVFDFVGMREAVGELRDGLEGREVSDGGGRAIGKEREASTAGKGGAEKELPLQVERTEVADSEDEDEDLEDGDDEMLFDTTALGSVADPVQMLPSNPTADVGTPNSGPEEQDTTNPVSQLPLKTILIDNLAHVLTPLLKQDAISANTLATTFLTTLLNMTSAHALHTILLNPCTMPRGPSPSRRPADDAPQGPPQGRAPQPPPPPSIFSSNVAVPALLGLMSRYADAHVLVSMLPRRKLDARVYYAAGRDRGRKRGVEMAGVVEVIADRRGGRTGAWAAFREEKDGGIAEF